MQLLSKKVDSTLQNVHLLTEKLGSKDNSIGLLLNDDALYKNLNATSANASLTSERFARAPETLCTLLTLWKER